MTRFSTPLSSTVFFLLLHILRTKQGYLYSHAYVSSSHAQYISNQQGADKASANESVGADEDDSDYRGCDGRTLHDAAALTRTAVRRLYDHVDERTGRPLLRRGGEVYVRLSILFSCTCELSR